MWIRLRSFLVLRDITFLALRGAQTNGRYEKYSKTIKKIYQILEKEYAKT